MKLSRNALILLILVVAAAGAGYYLWRYKAAQEGGKGEKGTQRAVQYTCPMHPFIIKDKPGACPICGMTLVPLKKAEGEQPKGKEMAKLGEVSLSPTQMLMANVATVRVERKPLAKEITAVGIVQYDQARQAKVTAWVAGRIERLYVNSVGAWVSRVKPVAEVYSPDLVSAQQEYLLALKSREQFRNSPIQSIAQGGEGLVASARLRLKLMGVKDEQIAALEKGGEPNIKLHIYTPLSGIVIEKIVQQGQYVNVGDVLFNIADLSTVWVEVEVYENDFPFIKVGQNADIVSQSYPGRTLTGRVSFIYPFLDPKTRTVKVRVEMPNPGGKLKPDMFVNATVKVPLGDSLVVPISALIDTGTRQVVWVEIKQGVFEPRDVKVGAREGDSIQVLAGLKPGEVVASSGGYLIDSEAQLKGGNGPLEGHDSMPGMKMEDNGAKPPFHPDKDKGGGMNMDDMKMQ